MTKAGELRQYADEAICLARKSKSKKDKAILIEIARVWTIAATYREVRGEKAAYDPATGQGGEVPPGVAYG
jgi:hypothetical protein